MTLVPGVIPDLSPARGFEGDVARGELRPRYEDITQDGRIVLTALVPALTVVWHRLQASRESAGFLERGIVPIMHRLVLRGEPGPFSVSVPFELEGTWRLARESDGDRIFLDMWVEARAPNASTWAPKPPPDAARALVGRAYVSHVFTRPFGAANERRVTRLDVSGLPPIPEDGHPYADADDLLHDPTLGTGPLELATEHTFGTMHTDSNQHVNSLVYPRLFEEAVVARLGTRSLARVAELRYRKPLFAGDTARLLLRTANGASGASEKSEIVAAGAFSPDGAKPSTAVAMWLR